MKITRTVEEYDSDGRLVRRVVETTESEPVTLQPELPGTIHPQFVGGAPLDPYRTVICEQPSVIIRGENGYANPGNIMVNTGLRMQ